MHRLPLISRLTALALIGAFGLQEIAMAAPIDAPFAVARPKPPIKLPGSIAMLDGFYSAGAAAPLVILLQDAHTNPSGQLNIARAIERIIAERPVSSVYLEAGRGDVSLADFKASTPLEIRRRTGLSFLKKGLLQGSEYANLTSERDFTLWGVENRALYERSLRVYREAVKLRPSALAALAKIRRAYDVIREERYGPDLSEWDAVVRRYRSGEIPITEYTGQIQSRLARLGIDEDFYPNLKSLTKFNAKESDFNQEQVQKEIRVLAEATAKTATDPADRLLIEDFMSGRSQDDLRADAAYELLFTSWKKMTAASSEARASLGHAGEYLEQRLRVQAVASEGLFVEIAASETEIGSRMAASYEERRLLEIGRALDMMQSAIELRLDSKSYHALNVAPERLSSAGVMGFLNRQIYELDKFYEKAPLRSLDLEKALQCSAEFYDLAARRDTVFCGLMRRRMESRGERQAVLITGGYHSEHLKNIFRVSGISYVSFIPRVSHETDSPRYEKLLLSQSDSDPAGRPVRTAQTTISLLQVRAAGNAPAAARLGQELTSAVGARMSVLAPPAAAAIKTDFLHKLIARTWDLFYRAAFRVLEYRLKYHGAPLFGASPIPTALILTHRLEKPYLEGRIPWLTDRLREWLTADHTRPGELFRPYYGNDFKLAAIYTIGYLKIAALRSELDAILRVGGTSGNEIVSAARRTMAILKKSDPATNHPAASKPTPNMSTAGARMAGNQRKSESARGWRKRLVWIASVVLIVGWGVHWCLERVNRGVKKSEPAKTVTVVNWEAVPDSRQPVQVQDFADPRLIADSVDLASLITRLDRDPDQLARFLKENLVTWDAVRRLFETTEQSRDTRIKEIAQSLRTKLIAAHPDTLLAALAGYHPSFYMNGIPDPGRVLAEIRPFYGFLDRGDALSEVPMTPDAYKFVHTLAGISLTTGMFNIAAEMITSSGFTRLQALSEQDRTAVWVSYLASTIRTDQPQSLELYLNWLRNRATPTVPDPRLSASAAIPKSDATSEYDNRSDKASFCFRALTRFTETPSQDPITTYFLKQGLEDQAAVIVERINNLHEDAQGRTIPPEVRFASVNSFTAKELFYLIASTDRRMYTSTYHRLMDRLMRELRRSGTTLQDIFEENHWYGLSQFAATAAGYGRMEDLLKSYRSTGPDVGAKERFVSEIAMRLMDKLSGSPEGLGRAGAIAKIFESPDQAKLMQVLVERLKLGYGSAANRGDRSAAVVHGLLAGIAAKNMNSADPWLKEMSSEFPARDKIVITGEEFFGMSKTQHVAVYFPADEDGKASYRHFVDFYKGKSKVGWKVQEIRDKKGGGATHAVVTSPEIGGRRITLTANNPSSPDGSDARDNDIKARVAKSGAKVMPFFRGHSFNQLGNLEDAFRGLGHHLVSAPVVFSGFCGGASNLVSMGEYFPSAVYYLATGGTATMDLNEKLSFDFLSALLRNNGINVQEFFQAEDKVHANTPGYDGYRPQHDTLGRFIISYQIAMARKHSGARMADQFADMDLRVSNPPRRLSKLTGAEALRLLVLLLEKPNAAGSTFRFFSFADGHWQLPGRALGLRLKEGQVYTEVGELRISDQDVLYVYPNGSLCLVRGLLELFNGTNHPFAPEDVYRGAVNAPTLTPEDLTGARMSVFDPAAVRRAVDWIWDSRRLGFDKFRELIIKYGEVPGMGHYLARLDPEGINAGEALNTGRKFLRRGVLGGAAGELFALDRLLTENPGAVPLHIGLVAHNLWGTECEIDLVIWSDRDEPGLRKGINFIEVKTSISSDDQNFDVTKGETTKQVNRQVMATMQLRREGIVSHYEILRFKVDRRAAIPLSFSESLTLNGYPLDVWICGGPLYGRSVAGNIGRPSPKMEELWSKPLPEDESVDLRERIWTQAAKAEWTRPIMALAVKLQAALAKIKSPKTQLESLQEAVDFDDAVQTLTSEQRASPIDWKRWKAEMMINAYWRLAQTRISQLKAGPVKDSGSTRAAITDLEIIHAVLVEYSEHRGPSEWAKDIKAVLDQYPAFARTQSLGGLNKFRKARPSKTNSWGALIRRARNFMNEGRWEEAQTLLDLAKLRFLRTIPPEKSQAFELKYIGKLMKKIKAAQAKLQATQTHVSEPSPEKTTGARMAGAKSEKTREADETAHSAQLRKVRSDQAQLTADAKKSHATDAAKVRAAIVLLKNTGPITRQRVAHEAGLTLDRLNYLFRFEKRVLGLDKTNPESLSADVNSAVDESKKHAQTDDNGRIDAPLTDTVLHIAEKIKDQDILQPMMAEIERILALPPSERPRSISVEKLIKASNMPIGVSAQRAYELWHDTNSGLKARIKSANEQLKDRGETPRTLTEKAIIVAEIERVQALESDYPAKLRIRDIARSVGLTRLRVRYLVAANRATLGKKLREANTALAQKTLEDKDEKVEELLRARLTIIDGMENPEVEVSVTSLADDIGMKSRELLRFLKRHSSLAQRVQSTIVQAEKKRKANDIARVDAVIQKLRTSDAEESTHEAFMAAMGFKTRAAAKYYLANNPEIRRKLNLVKLKLRQDHQKDGLAADRRAVADAIVRLQSVPIVWFSYREVADEAGMTYERLMYAMNVDDDILPADRSAGQGPLRTEVVAAIIKSRSTIPYTSDLYAPLKAPFGASNEEIGRAYRERHKERHPDIRDKKTDVKGGEDSTMSYADELRRAREILRHPHLRDDYDAHYVNERRFGLIIDFLESYLEREEIGADILVVGELRKTRAKPDEIIKAVRGELPKILASMYHSKRSDPRAAMDTFVGFALTRDSTIKKFLDYALILLNERLSKSGDALFQEIHFRTDGLPPANKDHLLSEKGVPDAVEEEGSEGPVATPGTPPAGARMAGFESGRVLDAVKWIWGKSNDVDMGRFRELIIKYWDVPGMGLYLLRLDPNGRHAGTDRLFEGTAGELFALDQLLAKNAGVNARVLQIGLHADDHMRNGPEVDLIVWADNDGDGLKRGLNFVEVKTSKNFHQRVTDEAVTQIHTVMDHTKAFPNEGIASHHVLALFHEETPGQRSGPDASATRPLPVAEEKDGIVRWHGSEQLRQHTSEPSKKWEGNMMTRWTTQPEKRQSAGLRNRIRSMILDSQPAGSPIRKVMALAIVFDRKMAGIDSIGEEFSRLPEALSLWKGIARLPAEQRTFPISWHVWSKTAMAEAYWRLAKVNMEDLKKPDISKEKKHTARTNLSLITKYYNRLPNAIQAESRTRRIDEALSRYPEPTAPAPTPAEAVAEGKPTRPPKTHQEAFRAAKQAMGRGEWNNAEALLSAAEAKARLAFMRPRDQHALRTWIGDIAARRTKITEARTQSMESIVQPATDSDQPPAAGARMAVDAVDQKLAAAFRQEIKRIMALPEADRPKRLSGKKVQATVRSQGTLNFTERQGIRVLGRLRIELAAADRILRTQASLRDPKMVDREMQIAEYLDKLLTQPNPPARVLIEDIATHLSLLREEVVYALNRNLDALKKTPALRAKFDDVNSQLKGMALARFGEELDRIKNVADRPRGWKVTLFASTGVSRDIFLKWLKNYPDLLKAVQIVLKKVPKKTVAAKTPGAPRSRKKRADAGHTKKYEKRVTAIRDALIRLKDVPWISVDRVSVESGLGHKRIHELFRIDNRVRSRMAGESQTRSLHDEVKDAVRASRKILSFQKDYYGLLDVALTATETEINKAYREKIRSPKQHLDALSMLHLPEGSPGQADNLKEQMILAKYLDELACARHVLTTPDLRDRFDAHYVDSPRFRRIIEFLDQHLEALTRETVLAGKSVQTIKDGSERIIPVEPQRVIEDLRGELPKLLERTSKGDKNALRALDALRRHSAADAPRGTLVLAKFLTLAQPVIRKKHKGETYYRPFVLTDFTRTNSPPADEDHRLTGPRALDSGPSDHIEQGARMSRKLDIVRKKADFASMKTDELIRRLEQIRDAGYKLPDKIVVRASELIKQLRGTAAGTSVADARRLVEYAYLETQLSKIAFPVRAQNALPAGIVKLAKGLRNYFLWYHPVAPYQLDEVRTFLTIADRVRRLKKGTIADTEHSLARLQNAADFFMVEDLKEVFPDLFPPDPAERADLMQPSGSRDTTVAEVPLRVRRARHEINNAINIMTAHLETMNTKLRSIASASDLVSDIDALYRELFGNSAKMRRAEKQEDFREVYQYFAVTIIGKWQLMSDKLKELKNDMPEGLYGELQQKLSRIDATRSRIIQLFELDGVTAKGQLPVNVFLKGMLEEAFLPQHGAVIDVSPDIALRTYDTPLYQVLVNLARNAQQAASPDRALQINVHAEKNEAERTVTLIMRDNGVGISSTDLEKIRSGTPFTTKREGSGIGLTVIREFVTDTLKGTFNIESTEGAGTTITLRLPTHVTGARMAEGGSGMIQIPVPKIVVSEDRVFPMISKLLGTRVLMARAFGVSPKISVEMTGPTGTNTFEINQGDQIVDQESLRVTLSALGLAEGVSKKWQVSVGEGLCTLYQEPRVISLKFMPIIPSGIERFLGPSASLDDVTQDLLGMEFKTRVFDLRGYVVGFKDNVNLMAGEIVFGNLNRLVGVDDNAHNEGFIFMGEGGDTSLTTAMRVWGRYFFGPQGLDLIESRVLRNYGEDPQGLWQTPELDQVPDAEWLRVAHELQMFHDEAMRAVRYVATLSEEEAAKLMAMNIDAMRSEIRARLLEAEQSPTVDQLPTRIPRGSRMAELSGEELAGFGARLAEVTITANVKIKKGIHAAPSTIIAFYSSALGRSPYDIEIQLLKKGTKNWIDASNMLSLLSMNAPMKSKVKIKIRGHYKTETLKRIAQIIKKILSEDSVEYSDVGKAGVDRVIKKYVSEGIKAIQTEKRIGARMAGLSSEELGTFGARLAEAQPAAVADGAAEFAVEFAPEQMTWLKVWRDETGLKITVFGETRIIDPSNVRQRETSIVSQGSDVVRMSAEQWVELQRIVMETSRQKFDLGNGRRGTKLFLNGLAGSGQFRQSRLRALAADASQLDKGTEIVLEGDEDLKRSFKEIYGETGGVAALLDASKLPVNFDMTGFSHVLSRGEWDTLSASGVKVDRPVILEDVKDDEEKVTLHIFGPKLRIAEALGGVKTLDISDPALGKIFNFYQMLMGHREGESATIEDFYLYLQGDGDPALFTLPVTARIGISEAVRLFALAARLSRQSA